MSMVIGFRLGMTWQESHSDLIWSEKPVAEDILWFNVYIKVPISECMKQMGEKPMGVMCVDVNEQGATNLKYRFRPVAEEIRTSAMSELYAAAPPLECLRMMTSSVLNPVATGARGEEPVRFIFWGGSRTYLYPPAIRPVYVKIVGEDFEEGGGISCGKFNVSMYGAIAVVLDLHHHYKEHLEGFGFIRGKASPHIFQHPQRSFQLLVHGDDYVVGGHGSDLDWFGKDMPKQYERKISISGPDPNQERQVRISNRILTFQLDQGKKC